MARIAFVVPVAAAIASFLAPRMFTMFDRRSTRQRFTVGRPPVDTAVRKHRATTDMSAHDMFERLAASVLTGRQSRDALAALASADGVPPVLTLACRRHLESPEPFGSVVHRVRLDLAPTQLCDFGALLSLCVADGVFVPGALRQAARLLRSDAELQRHISAQTAQARLTMRVLSFLPVGFLCLGAAASTAFRLAVVSAVGLVCLSVAAALNICGWLWTSRLMAAVWPSPVERDAHLLTLAFCVSLNAGHSIVGACLNLGDVNASGSRITRRLQQNAPLENALEVLVHDFGDTGEMLRRVIVDCASSGLPLHDSAEQIAASLGQRRTHTVTTRAQQLTTKLSIPVVLCMLPSFALAVLMPLLIASMSSLAAST